MIRIYDAGTDITCVDDPVAILVVAIAAQARIAAIVDRVLVDVFVDPRPARA